MLTHTRAIAAIRSAGLEYERNGKWTLTVRNPENRRKRITIEPCKVLYLRNVKPCAFYSFEALEAALSV